VVIIGSGTLFWYSTPWNYLFLPANMSVAHLTCVAANFVNE
jgi:hypothetical protein